MNCVRLGMHCRRQIGGDVDKSTEYCRLMQCVTAQSVIVPVCRAILSCRFLYRSKGRGYAGSVYTATPVAVFVAFRVLAHLCSGLLQVCMYVTSSLICFSAWIHTHNDIWWQLWLIPRDFLILAGKLITMMLHIDVL